MQGSTLIAYALGALLLSTWLSPRSTAQAQQRHAFTSIARDEQRRLVITVFTDSGVNREFTFTPWTEFLDQALSPDRRHVFFRYRLTEMANGQWRPHGARRLKIVRVADGSELGDFAPGAGGEFRWMRADRILFINGCGSNCEAYTVYDLTGNRVTHGLSESGFELVSVGDRFIVDFARRAEPSSEVTVAESFADSDDDSSCVIQVHDVVEGRWREYHRSECPDETHGLVHNNFLVLRRADGVAASFRLGPDSAWHSGRGPVPH